MDSFQLMFCFLNYLLVSGFNITFRDANLISCCDQNHIQRLHVLIKQLKWKSMVILQSEEGILPTTNGMNLGLPTVKEVVYHITAENLYTNLHEIHRNMFPDINIVLSGNNSFIEDIITKLDRFDQSTRNVSDFRHHSKLLIIGADCSVLGFQTEISCLENVAMVIQTKISPNFEVAMTLRHYPGGNVFTPVTECGADVSMCYFPNVQYGYNNRLIKVITLPSLEYTIKEKEGNTVVYKGYTVDILDWMSRILNFSYSIDEPADGSPGLQHNGSWNGIVKELQKNEFDLAASDLQVTIGRTSAVDFIYPPIETDAVTVLYRTYQPSFLFLLAKPLHWEVYVITLVVAVMVTILFRCTNINLAVPRNDSILSTDCCVDHVSRALVKQGAQASPVTESGRILISFWWMFLIVLTGVYSANLAASFSSSKRIHLFKTLKDVSESDFSLLIALQGITVSLFLESDLTVIKNLRNKISSTDRELTSMEDKIDKVKEDKVAVLTYSSAAEQQMVEDCELQIVKERIFFHHLAFAVPKQSTLKIDIEKAMSIISESGTLDRLWRKWFKKRNSTTCASEQRLNPISTQMFAGGFLILFMGIFLASLVLGFEKLKCHSRPRI